MAKDFFQIAKDRRSAKVGFLPGDAIGVDDLNRIVDAGRLAATGGNLQPWEFIVVTDPALLAALKSRKPSTAAAIVLAYDTTRALPDGRTYFREDLSAAAQNMLLAAESLGHAACWVQGGLDVDNVAEVLKVPARYRALIMLCLGRAAADAARRQKRPLEDVLHWQTFGNRTPPR